MLPITPYHKFRTKLRQKVEFENFSKIMLDIHIPLWYTDNRKRGCTPNIERKKDMNKVRRKALAELQAQIEDIKAQLEELLEEEQEAFDNIPENMEGSERYEKAEEAVSALEDAVSSLEECCEYIDTAIE